MQWRLNVGVLVQRVHTNSIQALLVPADPGSWPTGLLLPQYLWMMWLDDLGLLREARQHSQLPEPPLR